MNKSEKVFKISILILTAFLLFIVYIYLSNYVQTEKLYPWNQEWLDYSVWQKHAPSNCFHIDPNHLTFDGKEGILTADTGFMRSCNFTIAYLWFTISDLNYFQYYNPSNLTMPRYGNLSEKNRIGYKINASDMEPFKQYDYKLYFHLKNNFYNYYDLTAEGSTIGEISINFDNSINGYKCDDQECFTLIEGQDRITQERPIWRGFSKRYIFNNAGRFLIRFSPHSSFWSFVLKLLDTFILGSVAIIIYEVLNISVLQEATFKRKTRIIPNNNKNWKMKNFIVIMNFARWIILIFTVIISFRAFGIWWAILAGILVYLAFYYREKYPLSKKGQEANQNHIMNYTYSYFGGIFAAMAIAFILGQNPLKLPWNQILGFLLLTYGFGIISVTIIRLGFSKKSK